MFFEKIKLIFAKHKVLSVLLVVLFLCAVVLAGWLLYKNVLADELNAIEISATEKGIVGTLLGALVGGCLSLAGSLFVSRKAQKANSAIKRNNVIFKPLYNELYENHEVILKENPFPHNILYRKEQYAGLEPPQYTVWGRIKKDARYFEVPKKLKKAMEKLYGTLEEYEKTGKEAALALDRAYKEGFKLVTNKDIQPQANAGDYFLPYVMRNDRPDNDRLLWHGENNQEMADKLWKSLSTLPCESEELIRFKRVKDKWDKEEKYVVDLLATYIQYTNNRFEGV